MPTFRWAAAGALPTEVVLNQCGVSSTVFDPPLEVAAGDTLTLSYELSRSVSDLEPGGPPTGMSCAGRSCFTPPRFVPSAAKAAAP